METGLDIVQCGSKEQALKAVERNGYLLARAPDVWKDDFDVVMAAVSQNGMALEFASPRLRDDAVIAMAAIDQDVFALAHAGDRVRADPAIVVTAARKNFIVYRLAARSLIENYDFMVGLFRREIREQILCGFMLKDVVDMLEVELRVRHEQRDSILQQ